MESLLAAIGSDSSNAIDPEKEFNYGFKTITDIMAEDPNSHYWQTATPERKRKALELYQQEFTLLMVMDWLALRKQN